jgi:CRP-like cAMP-binding protein
VERRVARKLLELVDQHGEVVDGVVELEWPVNAVEFSSLVGATRPVVNRVLRRWEDEGMITRRGRRLVILDPERLRKRIL